MTIHYHGTPITPRQQLEKLKGKHFCVSYSARQDCEWCLSNGQSVMLDNGAFSAFTKGLVLNHNNLFSWIEDRLVAPHWAVCLDVIGGSELEQRTLLRSWPFPKHLSAPVWHMNLSLDYLLYLADEYPKICFGSSAEYWKVGSNLWNKRCDEAFTILNKHHKYLPWIHMLRGMNMIGKSWPFASADSTNIGRNFKRNKECPKAMAERIDIIQSIPKYKIPPDISDF